VEFSGCNDGGQIREKSHVNVSKVDGGREGRGERETVSSGRWIEDRQFGNGEKQTPWNECFCFGNDAGSPDQISY